MGLEQETAFPLAGPRLEDALKQDGYGNPPLEEGNEGSEGSDLQRRRANTAEDRLSEEDEGSEDTNMEEEMADSSEDDDEGVELEGEFASEGTREALLGNLQTLLDKKRAEEAGLANGAGGLSAHERRVLRMAETARKLEEENMGDKQWFMKGEAKAGMHTCCSQASLLLLQHRQRHCY